MKLGDGGFPGWWWLWMGGVSAWVGYTFIIGLRRRRDLAILATKLGLQKWPRKLDSDDFRWTDHMLQNGRIYNCYEGNLGGIRVAFFDYKKGSGKSARSTTVITVRAKDDAFTDREFKFTEEQIGEWYLLYPTLANKSNLIDIDEIELLLNQIAKEGRIVRMPLTHSSL